MILNSKDVISSNKVHEKRIYKTMQVLLELERWKKKKHGRIAHAELIKYFLNCYKALIEKIHFPGIL